jgi:hypothetical protein
MGQLFGYDNCLFTGVFSNTLLTAYVKQHDRMTSMKWKMGFLWLI